MTSLFATLFMAFLLSCSASRNDGKEHIEFWGLGREGEVVADLIPEFERQNPGIKVDVQQIPWSAAHEKLLTAHVGDSSPDLAQMGNTWVPEFVAVDALENLDPWIARSPVVNPEDHFKGIWLTNVVDGHVYGVPWYVDTRLLFYRKDILAAAGFQHPPRSWSEWLQMMETIKKRSGKNQYAILLPTNEWAQPVALGLQLGSPLLANGGRNGGFSGQEFSRAFEFYVDMFRRGYTPGLSNQQIANVYQQFADGEFAMYITGPWNVGEFRRRMPAAVQDKWATAPLPAPDGKPYPGVSLAGGASLVIFKASPHKEAAWKLIEFLERPEQQIQFWKLTGDLPALKSAWKAKGLADDPNLAAFAQQLENVVPTPQVPEWEQIAAAVFEHAESAIRGQMTTKQALAALDKKTDWILEKRRWVLAKRESEQNASR